MSVERRIIIIGRSSRHSEFISRLLGDMAMREETGCKAEKVYYGDLAAGQRGLLELDQPRWAKSIIQGPPFWSADYRNRRGRKC